MKKAVVGILNRVPVVLIVIGEALVIYLATAVAKLAFTQLDPLYSVWYRVGFMAVLLLLVFSKYFYMASLTSYYTFYLMAHFGLGIQSAQLYLFVFLFAVALGTILGGPLGDRIGRKRVIWFSILGAAPFSLLVPYANLAGTVALTFLAGMILASAFSAIVVYAQELLPGRVGMVSGLIFGFAFGVGGMGAGLLGQLADHYGIETVYRLCAWLPLLGVCAVLLPDLRRHAARH